MIYVFAAFAGGVAAGTGSFASVEVKFCGHFVDEACAPSQLTERLKRFSYKRRNRHRSSTGTLS